jgi:hypothetical protein
MLCIPIHTSTPITGLDGTGLDWTQRRSWVRRTVKIEGGGLEKTFGRHCDESSISSELEVRFVGLNLSGWAFGREATLHFSAEWFGGVCDREIIHVKIFRHVLAFFARPPALTVPKTVRDGFAFLVNII